MTTIEDRLDRAMVAEWQALEAVRIADRTPWVRETLAAARDALRRASAKSRKGS